MGPYIYIVDEYNAPTIPIMHFNAPMIVSPHASRQACAGQPAIHHH